MLMRMLGQLILVIMLVKLLVMLGWPGSASGSIAYSNDVGNYVGSAAA